MMKTAFMCCVSAMALCMTGAAFAERPARPVTNARGEAHRVISAVPGSITLYDQNNNLNNVAIESTNFTDDFDSYSAYGADDFTVPAGHKWRIKEVEVTGVYAGADGPAASESVVFYKDEKGLPGAQVAGCYDLNGIDNQGSFAIKIPKSCKVALKGGRDYWVSVFASMDFICCGEWQWQTRQIQNGNLATWENPKDGFGTGCTTWNAIASCLGDNGQGPDFMFALKGRDVVVQRNIP